MAYHCRHCAEKYLKALFVQNCHRTPFIHDLLKLNQQVQNVCTVLEQCGGTPKPQTRTNRSASISLPT
ncbi:MAG: HEPN domain-containing protein [Spirochaetaceae bacterium]|nr:HEPN domain-containing protein [Spirochaetaceae bacterium]